MIHVLVGWGILIFALSIPALATYHAALHFISDLPGPWVAMAGVVGCAVFVGLIGITIFCILWLSYLFFLVPQAKREGVEEGLSRNMNVAFMDPIYSTIKKLFVKKI